MNADESNQASSKPENSEHSRCRPVLQRIVNPSNIFSVDESQTAFDTSTSLHTSTFVDMQDPFRQKRRWTVATLEKSLQPL